MNADTKEVAIDLLLFPPQPISRLDLGLGYSVDVPKA